MSLPLVLLSSEEDFLCLLNLLHLGLLMLSWLTSCPVSVCVPAVLVQLEEMWDRDLTEPDLDQLEVREILEVLYESLP